MVEEMGFIRAISSGTVDGIKDSYTDAEIAAMTKVKNLTKFISGQTYAIVDIKRICIVIAKAVIDIVGIGRAINNLHCTGIVILVEPL